MNTDKKRRFDAIMELCKMSWDRISERRKYEWRVAFAIWGAIGSLIVILLTGRLTGFSNVTLTIIIGIVGLVICVAHGTWLHQLHKSFTLDRKMAFSDEEKLRELSNTEFSEEVLKRLEARRKEMERFTSTWSSISGLVITALLVVMTCLVALFIG